jgi:hypothetical protein
MEINGPSLKPSLAKDVLEPRSKHRQHRQKTRFAVSEYIEHRRGIDSLFASFTEIMAV